MIHIPPEIWGLLSVGLAVFSMGPYLVATIKGTNKPHILTWVIWAILTIAAFLIQYFEGAGSGSWSGGVSAFLTCIIMIFAFKYGEKQITKSDWGVFFLALAVVPIWLLTKNAAMAALWVTIIDGLGYIPTFRKSWGKPFEEYAMTHGLSSLKHVFVLLAIENFTFATTVYSWGMIVMNGGLFLMIVVRRLMVKKEAQRAAE